MSFLQRTAELKFAVALGAALAISACAKAPDTLAGVNGGRAAPGSPQDFAVNAGDRVFFDSDFERIELDRAGDPRQAGDLATAI